MRTVTAAILASISLALSLSAADLAPALADFDRQFKASNGGEELIQKAVAELKTKITAADLPKLEAFAAERDDAVTYALLPVFVDHKQFDSVVKLAVRSATKEKSAETRREKLWEFWGDLVGERDDFVDLTVKLSQAFANRYEKAEAKEREVIASLFGRKAGTPAEFRRYLEQKAAPATEADFR